MASAEKLFVREQIAKNFPLVQPKAEIGRYVAEQGFHVPKIFDEQEIPDAIHGGVSILARSEHPDEFAGPSGLFSSSHILTDAVSGMVGLTNKEALVYCSYAGLDQRKYLSYLTYSFWQFIPGINVVVVEDNVFSGKYYIKAVDRSESKDYPNILFSVFEDGKQEDLRLIRDKTRLSKINLANLVEHYIAISNLPKLKTSAGVPKMEFQMDLEDRIHFLQYHLVNTRRPLENQFMEISPELKVKPNFIRGRTNGVEKVNIVVGGDYIDVRDKDGSIGNFVRNKDLTAFVLNSGKCYALSEYLAMNKDIIVVTLENFIEYTCNSHLMDSLLFKPRVSVILDPGVIKRLEDNALKLQISDSKKKSDSTKAYVTTAGIWSNGKEFYIEPA